MYGDQPAYPRTEESGGAQVVHMGMSKRELFAMHMQAQMMTVYYSGGQAQKVIQDLAKTAGEEPGKTIAKIAEAHADLLLARLKETST